MLCGESPSPCSQFSSSAAEIVATWRSPNAPQKRPRGMKRDRSINLRAMHFKCYILSIRCVIVPAKFMRFPRVKADGQGFYHCISRVVEGRFIFQVSGHGSVEAERFIMLMRRLEAFSGVRVLTYVLMSNHFHLLCEVPEPKTLSEAEVLDRVEAGYGRARRQSLQEEIARYRQQPDGNAQVQRLLDRYRRRMYDISVFIKELKGRFAQWYNQRHDRYGVLWAERFKSVLLEGGEALAAVAAYIEINPVRAGLCSDPKDYRYCGYAEALSKGFSSCPSRDQNHSGPAGNDLLEGTQPRVSQIPLCERELQERKQTAGL